MTTDSARRAEIHRDSARRPAGLGRPGLDLPEPSREPSVEPAYASANTRDGGRGALSVPLFSPGPMQESCVRRGMARLLHERFADPHHSIEGLGRHVGSPRRSSSLSRRDLTPVRSGMRILRTGTSARGGLEPSLTREIQHEWIHPPGRDRDVLDHGVVCRRSYLHPVRRLGSMRPRGIA